MVKCMNKLGRLRKKAGITLAMALVIAEAANLQYIPAYAATTGTVNCDVLNVRSGGSTDTSVITTLTKGTQVDILSSENGWYAISVNGTTGYVSAQYVSTDDGSSNSGGGTAVSGQTGSVNVGVLNLRSEASTDSSVIGALYSGQTVTVTESSNGWYKVTTASGTSGYVYAQYITLGGGSSNNGGGDTNNTPSENPADVTPASGEGVCNTNALNVRSDANTNASILGYITYGTKVTITGTTGTWYKVNTTIGGSSVSGFVHATYITMGSSGGSDGNEGNGGNSNGSGSEVTPASGEGVCNTSALNVRKEASTSAATYGLINQGTKVTILGKTGEWYQVKTKVNGSEVTGFVHSSYITISSDSGNNSNSNNSNNNGGNSEAPTVDPASGEGVCNTTALNVRKEASTSAGVHGLIYKDDKVTITGKTGSWYQVKTKVNGSEVTGYVHTDYITITDNSSNNNNNNGDGNGNSNTPDINEVNETVWATTAVNVRKESNTSSAIVATLRKDASVTRTGVVNNGWSRVSYNGESAYIHSDYLTTTNPNPGSDPSGSGSGSSGIDGVTGQDIVAYAKQWVGYPYVWGGNNLSTGVDCSGFTQQVYLHFGITLNRIADAQKQNGIRISSVSEAKAGDLFFYGSSSYADHVAIYMGDGNVVHASSPTVGIIISPISYRTPVAIVRVIY